MIGSTISHYKIIEEIGRGGMGVVYKARDTQLDRDVALKFLPAQFSADEGERKRFIHEAKAAAALNHANIVTVYETGEHEGQVFIAMEYVAGRTLKDMISGSVGANNYSPLPLTHHPLPITQVLDIATQLASGLAAAHEKGIVHRDLKPANIMLTEQGQAKIVDFGLAKLKGMSRLTRSGTTLGTVAYMSPEQALGKEVDQRSDIWSLGVILYEMLTNKLPFPAEYEQAMLYAVINEEPESISKIRSDIPDELRRIVRKALAKAPEKRYQTTDELLKELKQFHQSIVAPETVAFNFRRFFFRVRILVPAFLVLCLLATVMAFYLKRQANIRRARYELLPRIEQIARYPLSLDLLKTYRSALEVEKYIPHDPQLAAIFEKYSVRFTINTDPPGAKVFVKYYQEPEKEWNYLGVSPIKDLRVPFAFLRLKMERLGYEPVLAAAASWGNYDPTADKYSPREISMTLDKKGAAPAGMVRVSGTEFKSFGRIEDFYMDRFEVTNRQYREFILMGGYQKREYWKHPFTKEGKPLTWEQAMAAFVDKSGLPGPAIWQAGDYAEGEDDYPVCGISWYEASAYAEFAGKTLPSVCHWGRASGALTGLVNNLSNRIFMDVFVTQSNFKGKEPEPVGSNPAISAFGLYDMGGNVREWCFNETEMGRLVRGGSWDDVPYLFSFYSQLPPFDRSAKNGFRCSLYIHPEKVPSTALAPVKIKGLPDYSKLKPVPDQIFQVYREQYAYDRLDLDSKLEARNDSAQEWTVEKVSFAAAYDNERIPAFLYLPKGNSPPFQTLIYFDGSNSTRSRSSKPLENPANRHLIPPLLKNGRAVLFPIYKGTYERGSASLAAIHDGVYTRQYTEYFIKVVKDFKRSIDYLETRPDIDTQRLAYLGFSWGGCTASIITAVEERLKASVLNVAGFYGDPRPEVDWVNYVTRIKIPTLMLNGRYDMSVPFELSAKPMYDLIGTPAADKQLILYNTDHIIPLTEFIRESAKWLDKYLGPVKR